MNLAHPSRKQVDSNGPLLALNDVRVSYAGIEALKGISLHVSRGEIVALVGANGAGKTTTLKSIARVVPLASGAITYEDRDATVLDVEHAARAGIALVPEGRAIFPNLTVRENLEIGAYVHRDKNAMRETEADIVALFPRLGERMSQSGQTLSGGEQQMLAIGRALMARPSLLLLDEPSLGIAPKLVEHIFRAVEDIAKSGMTILLVEQNTRLALAVSQRGYVLRAGEIVVEGSSSDLAGRADVREAYLGG